VNLCEKSQLVRVVRDCYRTH